MQSKINLKSTAFIFLILVLVCFLLYFQGFSGPFFVDDYSNFVNIKIIQQQNGWNAVINYILSSEAGTLKRPISNLSFLIHTRHWPADPYLFKLFNFIFHTINGVLLFIISRYILILLKYKKYFNINRVALYASLIWTIHPFFVSTVLYSVQRMAILPVSFILIGCILYIKGRLFFDKNDNKGLLLMLTSIYICTTLAVLSKENGIVLPFLLYCFEIIVICPKLDKKLNLKIKSILFYLPMLVIILAFVVRFDGLIAGYINRDFSLYERLLSQPRAIIMYMYHLLVPAYMTEGFYTDGFIKSTGLFEPISTLFSFLIIVLLLVLALIRRTINPIFSFSILFFFIGIFLESSFLPLELYFEHRVYMPSLFLSLFVVVHILKYSTKIKYLKLLPILIILFLAFNTYLKTKLWGSDLALHLTTAEMFPNSKRAANMKGSVLLKSNKIPAALETYKQGMEYFKAIEFEANYINILCLVGGMKASDLTHFENTLQTVKFKISDTSPFNNLINTIRQNKCKKISASKGLEFIKIIETTEANILKPMIETDLAYDKALLLIASGKYDEGYKETIYMLKVNVYPDASASLFQIVNIYLDNKQYEYALKVLSLINDIVESKRDVHHYLLTIEQYKKIIHSLKNNDYLGS